MSRLFVAVDPPVSIQEVIWKTFEPFHDRWRGIRWEKSDKLHITLKFLGSVTVDEVHGIRSVLSNAVSECQEFEARLDCAGAFPSPARPRIVWVGIGMGSESLGALHGLIDSALNSIGFPREKRKFSSHITVGRIKRFSGALPLSRVVVPAIAFPVQDIILKESTLTPRGSIYVNVAGFRFAASREGARNDR